MKKPTRIEFRDGAEVKADGPQNESVATKLIALALEEPDLFHNRMNDAYTTVAVEGRHETIPVRSGEFKRLLAWKFYQAEDKAAQPQALTAAIHTLEAIAVHEKSRKEVHRRFASHDGAIYLNLANPEREIVKISPTAWSVIASANAPVRFLNLKGMLPLPDPVCGGTLESLRKLANVTDDDWALFIGYALGCFLESGPYPILALLGEAAAGKSTLTRLVKALIDPAEPMAKTLPTDERDLMIQAESGHVLAFDNVSRLDEVMSDALCRLATGGGLSTRSLYSDRDQTIFHGARPIVLNSITEVMGRGDLMSRAIRVEVPPLRERKPEAAYWAEFQATHAGILGALCDAAVVALQEVPDNDWAPDVRMVDFALFVERGEVVLGLEPESFVRAYEANQTVANDAVVEQSAVALAVMAFASHQLDEWEGTTTDLLNALTAYASEQTRKSREWPETAKGLSNALKRLRPNLRRAGIEVKELDRKDPITRRTLLSVFKAQK